METLKAHDWVHTIITAGITAVFSVVAILWAVEQWRVSTQATIQEHDRQIKDLFLYNSSLEDKWKPLVNMNTSVIVRHYPDEVKEYRIAQGWK